MGKIIIGLTDHTQKEDPKMEEQEEQGKRKRLNRKRNKKNRN